MLISVYLSVTILFLNKTASYAGSYIYMQVLPND